MLGFSKYIKEEEKKEKVTIHPQRIEKKLSDVYSTSEKMKALDHKDVKNHDIDTASIIDKATDDGNPKVRKKGYSLALSSAEGRRVSETHLKKGIVDPDPSIRKKVMGHEFCSPELIATTMNGHLEKIEKEQAKAQEERSKKLDDRVQELKNPREGGRK